MLLKHGADPNGIGDVLQQPTLSWAVLNGSIASVETLLDHGADPNAAATFFTVGSSLEQIFRDSPRADDAAAAIHLLLVHGADPNPWIGVAFQTLARDKDRNDLLAAELASRPMVVKSEWIRSALASEGSVNGRIPPLLTEAAAIRDSTSCPPNASAELLERCLPNALRRTDQDLNALYEQLTGVPGAAITALRTAQRRWLRDRDARCGLRESPPLTEGGWLAYVLADQARAVCVMSATEQRLGELRSSASPVSHH
jgi:uncharacterized protein YecT (DUF1311 family)